MFRAMALKELREIRGIAIAAIVVFGMLTFAAISPNEPLNPFYYLGRSSVAIPFVSDYSVGKYYFFAGLMAVVFGLWQTFGESIRGTYPFLLHRPASVRWLVGMKLFVGTVVFLVASAILPLIYAMWAATPGNHASPFEWSMTVPVWVTWSAMTIPYFGAFLTGIMPGREDSARFLPLAASVLILIIVAVFANTLFEGAMWPLCVVLAVDVWILAMIFFVARSRDYS